MLDFQKMKIPQTPNSVYGCADPMMSETQHGHLKGTEWSIP